MKLKKTTPVILLFACILMVQGAMAVFDDWDGTIPRIFPDSGPVGPDGNSTSPRFNFNDTSFGPFSDRVLPDRNATKSWYFFNDTLIRPGSGEYIFPGWNGTKPRFPVNDSSSWPFGNRVTPDWNSTKPRFPFNDTPFVPGSGNGMMPGWNGRKPSFSFSDTGDGPKTGSGLFAS